MKRSRILAILITLALLAALTGCSSGTAPSGGSAAPSSEAPAADSGDSDDDDDAGSADSGSTSGWVPEQTITLLVGNSAGGGADLFAREIAKIITQYGFCEQPVIVENKPGGSHTVAFSYLAEQKGNEYILGTVSASFYTMPLSGNSPVSVDDFEPVAHFCKDPNMVVMPANSPFDSLEEMIAFARDNPKALKYAGSGTISDDAIICAALNELAGIEIEYVPFEAGSDILAALLGGHVDMGAMGPSEAIEHLSNDDLKPLAVVAYERLDFLPDVPIFTELGYDVTQQQSRAFVMQKDVPYEVIDYYADVMEKVSETPEWKEYLEINGMVEMFMGNEEYDAFNEEIISAYQKYIDIIMAGQ